MVGVKRVPSFLPFTQIQWLDSQYERYRNAEEKIDLSWKDFFDGLELGQSLGAEDKELLITNLIEAYRNYGYLKVQVNPLKDPQKIEVKQLNLIDLGFTDADLNRLFPTNGLLPIFEAPLKEIVSRLEDIYCNKVGFENNGSDELKQWLADKLEKDSKTYLSREKKVAIVKQLNHAELFEIFLHTKYVGQKRFSLEGGETLIPLLEEVIERGSALGIEEVVIGMPHRGRLNVLVNLMNKSLVAVFNEFEEAFEDPSYLGDVKYHKGYSSTIKTAQGASVHISLTPNPSHLESVDPVVEGKVKAKQRLLKDEKKQKVLPILIHGDAAIAGQGVVYECLQLYQLEGYSTGGSLHIVANNQIGFTTLPKEGRSTLYCTDIAKSFSAPVFHVNAEDPEGCVFAAALACEIRQKFSCDVFIDMNCYRKYGHNESDEPAFTQPLEQKKIRVKRSIRELYREMLLKEGAIEKQVIEELEKDFKKNLHDALEQFHQSPERLADEAFEGVWKKYHSATLKEVLSSIETKVSLEKLTLVAEKLFESPHSFNLHPKLRKMIEERKKNFKESPSTPFIDWSLAEQFALGTLLLEKVNVRLSGQDSQRGTFSQRHAAWVDQETSERYFPLQHLSKEQGRFEVIDSPLSEYAALGFEFGYSLADPLSLIIWEAQFGDFANGAQIIIDQYLSASEQKWLRHSGLVLLLPHGYEGQGPEHSSARIERFLQLAGHENLQIVYPTYPSQYFHVLRRQVVRSFRKPLVVFTPKGLLRHAECVSSFEDLTTKKFEEIIEDDLPKESIERVLLCSGKFYFDLKTERKQRENQKTAIVRIEQLYPLHQERLTQILNSYTHLKEVVWAQEEPENMGPWHFIYFQVRACLKPEISFFCVSRPSSASPAIGSHKGHEKQQKELLIHAFEKKGL